MKKIDKIILPCFAILLVVIITFTVQSDMSRQIEDKKQIQLLDEFLKVESMTQCRDLEQYMKTPNANHTDLADTMMRQKPCTLIAFGIVVGTDLKFIDEATCEDLRSFMQFDSIFFINNTKMGTEKEQKTRSDLTDELNRRCI